MLMTPNTFAYTRYGFLQESNDNVAGMETYVYHNCYSRSVAYKFAQLECLSTIIRIKEHEAQRAQKWAKMAKKRESNGEVMHYFDWSPKVAHPLNSNKLTVG